MKKILPVSLNSYTRSMMSKCLSARGADTEMEQST